MTTSRVHSMQILLFIFRFLNRIRYLCLHLRSSSPPREWKIRKQAKTRSDPLQAVDRSKNAIFGQICAFRRGRGKVWRVYRCRETCLRHTCGTRGAAISERRTAAAPHERSPEKELQVQPGCPCASGEREPSAAV